MNNLLDGQADRQAGIDLLKLIHYIGYSSVLNKTLSQYNKILLLSLSSLTTIAINLFPIITGYLLSYKRSTFKRPFKIWCEGWFYSICCCIIGMIITKNEITIGKIIQIIFPFITHHYWYLTAVIILYFSIPVLNKLFSSFTLREFRKILIVTGAFITLFYALNPFIDADIYLGHAHGVLWMSYLYLVGRYLGQEKVNKKRWYIIGTISFISIFVIKWFGLDVSKYNISLLSQNSVFPTFLSISFFVILKDKRIRGGKLAKILMSMANCSFGVYLIQEHCLIRSTYWHFFDANKYINSPFLVVQMISAVAFLWLCAFVFHTIFLRVFNWVGIKVYNKTETIVRTLLHSI